MAEETQSCVPEIRFGEFDGEWENKTLGDLGSVAMNKRIFKHQTSNTGDVPFYKIGTFGGRPDSFIPRALFEKYKALYPYPEKGDLLISAAGSIGRVVEYAGEEEYFQDSNIVWLKHDGKIDNSFLKPFYQRVKWAGLEGSTIKRLYNKNILETAISCPGPDEQSLIGQHFAKLDQMISQHQRKHAKLVALKKAMLQKMFPRDGARTPEIRFKGFSGDWEEKALGEVFCYERPDKYIVESAEYSEKHKTPVLTANKAFILGYTNEVRTFNQPCLIFDDFTLESRYVDFPFMVKSSAIKILTINDERIDDLYFASLVLQNADIEMLGHARHYIGVVQPSVVMTPGIDEQCEISSYFHRLEILITRHLTQITKLRNIKSACLEKMFV